MDNDTNNAKPLTEEEIAAAELAFAEARAKREAEKAVEAKSKKRAFVAVALIYIGCCAGLYGVTKIIWR